MARSPADLLAPGRPLTLAGVADGAQGMIVADLARAVAAHPDAPATSLLVICRAFHLEAATIQVFDGAISVADGS